MERGLHSAVQATARSQRTEVRAPCVHLLLAMLASGCRQSNENKEAPSRWPLFEAPLIDHWQDAKIDDGGEVKREADGFTLKEGAPMTGNVFPTWEQDGLPLINYRVTYEAMRVSGSDFFGSVTFPVGSRERCVTFVLGGWGGTQVGISSIDGSDASQNPTGSSHRFEDGRWYRIRIEVEEQSLRVWLDDLPLVSFNPKGRQLHLRGADIAKCVPFGFATFGTEGRVRACVVERL
jgi:hypothetical protein